MRLAQGFAQRCDAGDHLGELRKSHILAMNVGWSRWITMGYEVSPLKDFYVSLSGHNGHLRKGWSSKD